MRYNDIGIALNALAREKWLIFGQILKCANWKEQIIKNICAN